MESIQTNTKHQTILLVDSDLDIINDAHDYVAKHASEQMTILFAKNAKEAMAQAAKNKIDLVIIEVILPILNGYQLIEWLNKNHPEVEVLVYTRIKGDSDFDRLATLTVKNILIKQQLKLAQLLSALEKGESMQADLNRRVIEIKSSLKEAAIEASPEALKVVTCPKCHVVLSQSSRYCNNCGQRLVKNIKNQPTPSK